MDSPIRYTGGKSKLRGEILSMIPAHRTYIEPFCGASWLLFHKPISQIEFINDIDNDLINLYMVIKNKHHEFIEYLDMIPISEVLYNSFTDHKGIPTLEQRYTKKVPEGIPERAARFYYVLMNSFNGKISDKPTFSIDPNRRKSIIRFYTSDWKKISNRLKEITILNRNFKDVIKSLDSPESFFYLDPPYMCATNNKRYYKHTFSNKDHELLKVYLEDLEGKFILSYGDDKRIMELYRDFNIIQSKNYPNELLITNYDVPKKSFYCVDGIPKAPGVISRANWDFPNCPYCGSREIQQVSKRVTLNGGRRSWLPCGYTCRSCRELFRGSA